MDELLVNASAVAVAVSEGWEEQMPLAAANALTQWPDSSGDLAHGPNEPVHAMDVEQYVLSPVPVKASPLQLRGLSAAMHACHVLVVLTSCLSDAQKHMNVTKTVRKVPVDADLVRMGVGIEDTRKSGPKYDDEQPVGVDLQRSRLPAA